MLGVSLMAGFYKDNTPPPSEFGRKRGKGGRIRNLGKRNRNSYNGNITENV